MNKRTIASLAVVLTVCGTAAAQERLSSSIYLLAQDKTDVTIPFFIGAEGRRFEPTWGLDQAWVNEQNLRKGVNHMGAENVGIGRTAFRTTKALKNDSVLQSDQITFLRRRANMFDIVSKELPLVFTADQEPGSDAYFVENKVANAEHWAANINSHVHWMQANTKHPIVGVSPFNEPDYWTVEEGATPAKQRDVAKLLTENYPRMADIAIVGSNTLNDDKAWTWFNTGKNYYSWGNTHQLAGSFDNFANFFERLSALGKVGYADEMHNVVEAMVGLEYGMTVGIWWAFDSRARGEFCDISRHGRRLAYGEHRNNWTAASVYQHDDGRVKAFVGSSERQAATTTYQFVSPDREVYFDGQGPMRSFIVNMPGGTGYQNGQTNAERVVDVTWGDDVAPRPISEGIYKIVNLATGNVAAASSDNIVLQKYTATRQQQWTIKPSDERIGGDYSFYDIESVNNNKLRMNVLNFSTKNGANVMAYSQNEKPSSNEQWYLTYAGNGYYYLRNRETALYLTAASTNTANGTNIMTYSLLAEDKRDRQLWRLLPVDTDYEVEAPAKPEGLTAEALPAAVSLTWADNSEADLDGYMVLRAPKGTDDWNTIARRVKGNQYVDNTCLTRTLYIYKVKAVDRADNQSEPSDGIEAGPTGAPTLIAHYDMEGSLADASNNAMDAVGGGKPAYKEEAQTGNQCLSLTATSKSFVQLPYEVASSDELTFAAWIKLSNTTRWQRIFDFGYDTDHYLFLTPNAGSAMRFAIKNGGEEQSVDCPKTLPSGEWKHVAVTIAQGRTAIYVDGEEVASSSAITISPRDVRPALNYLGRSQFSSDPFLTASLDDVRIYNYALTAQEVKNVADKNTVGVAGKTVDTAAGTTKTYTLEGRMVKRKTRRGITIKTGNGKVRKTVER